MIKLKLPERLETNRLLLQRLRYEDAEEIFYGYASKQEATKYMSWPTHQSINDTREFVRYAILAWSASTDFTYTIRLKDSNLFIGSFGLINEVGRIQFGYVLSPTFWGVGYATECCAKMMNTLQGDPIVFRINTYVDLDNVPSMRVLIKSGLKQEAILKNWMRFPNQDHKPKDCAVFAL